MNFHTKMRRIKSISAVEIFNKNISVDLLKKVILYRVQEIIDLSLNKLQINLKIQIF